MNVLSLFAGVGGLELGLERAGMTTVGQVEIDPYCQRVLARHWPEVPRHDDVRTAPDWWDSEPRPTVDVVCGGFPCQPFSNAGFMLGIADERWAWPWMEAVVDGQSRDCVVAGRSGYAPIPAGGLPRLSVPAQRRAADAWLAREPRVDRLVDGIPNQVDRLRVDGNAVVPQIAEHIGRWIMSAQAVAA